MLIDKEEYKNLVAERDSLKASLETATADAATKDAKIAELEQQLAEVNNGTNETAAELETLRQSVEQKDAEISALKATSDHVAALEVELTEITTSLRELKNTWQPATRENVAGGKNNVDAAKPVDMERVREIQAKL